MWTGTGGPNNITCREDHTFYIAEPEEGGNREDDQLSCNVMGSIK